MTTIARRTLAAAAAASVAALASAQTCLGPDGFTDSCFKSVTPNLPVFPDIALEGSAICFDDCNPNSKEPVLIKFSAPTLIPFSVAGGPEGCHYTSEIEILDATGFVFILKAKADLTYSRTWEEVSPSGQIYQVYRLLTRVDLFSSGLPGPPDCVVPPCAQQDTAYYYGYIDYAQNCQDQTWSSSAVLFHNCDVFIHNPSISTVPGSFHGSRTYALVGPDTVADPFLPSTTMTPPGGPLVAEAVRSADLASCMAEEPLATGSLLPVFQLCGCPILFGPKQLHLSLFSGTGSCPDPFGGPPSSFVSVDSLPYGLPWFHLESHAIGRWTGGGVYPGDEAVFVSEGVFGYRDSGATLFGASGNEAHIFYGAMTTDGWTALPTLGPITQKFVDLVDNYSASFPGVAVGPFVGSVMPTDQLIYANL